MVHDQLIVRIEECYDAIPRVGGARVEEIGPFDLFVQQGPGWPYYARPRLGTTTVTPADVAAVRDRQRELSVPEAFEWVHELVPSALPAVEATGLQVLRAPLMVLTEFRDVPVEPGVTVRLLSPTDRSFAADYAAGQAVAHLGFAAGGTERGDAGPTERDEVPAPDDASVERAADRIRAGLAAYAQAETAVDGALATGALQLAAGAAELAGVATLPAARRRGLGAAVSALLARYALDAGADPIFLGAASPAVARVYARIGFTQIGTACISG